MLTLALYHSGCVSVKNGVTECEYKPPAFEIQDFYVEVAMVNQFYQMTSVDIKVDINGSGIIPEAQKTDCTKFNLVVYSPLSIQELVMSSPKHNIPSYCCSQEQIEILKRVPFVQLALKCHSMMLKDVVAFATMLSRTT